MAGIGFELRKLFTGKGYLDSIKAYFVSSLVTVGPMILCITLMTVLQILLMYVGVDFSQRELFLSAMVYAFVFSLVVASIFIMLASRYIADMVFIKDYNQIIASFYGVIVVCLPIGGLLGGIFYQRSPIDLPFKLAAYLFYMELIVIWIQAIYISLFRDYFKILIGFLTGVVTAIILSCVALLFTEVRAVLGLLISIDIGFFVIMVSYMHYLKRFLSDTDRNIFNFISYIDRYPSLIFICFFYNLGMYSHNFVFWLSEYGVRAADTYSFAPFYDVPMFYAYFTIVPTLVLFVVTVETSFIEKYKNYYGNINNGGNYQEIEMAKKEMSVVLAQEISYIMEVQLFFSIISLLIGRKLLPKIGMTGLSIDIFSILVLGCYVFVLMFVIILILLYFDDRKGALITTSFFLPSNILFSMLTLQWGEAYFGLGFFISGFCSLLIGLGRLIYYIRNIDYYTFCSQPILYKEQIGLFTKLSRLLEKKNAGSDAGRSR